MDESKIIIIKILGILFVIFGFFSTFTGMFWAKYIQSRSQKPINGFFRMLRYHFSLTSESKKSGTLEPELKLFSIIFFIPHLITRFSFFGAIVFIFFSNNK